MKKKLIMYSYWFLCKVLGPIILFGWSIPMSPLAIIAFSMLQESAVDGLVTTINALTCMGNLIFVPRSPKELWEFIETYDFDKLFKF